MRVMKFLFLIIFALKAKGEGLILNQREAILGEPVIMEAVGKDFYEFNRILFLEGPVTLCIDLSKYQGEERINLVDLFKEEGEYEISIIEKGEICNLKKELEALKMDFEREEDERRRGYLEISLKYKEMAYFKALKELKRKGYFKIKISYPKDFDRYFYEKYFLERENLEEFWQKGLYEGGTREEFLRMIKEVGSHPESRYFPWLFYISFNNNLDFHLNPENDIYKNLDKVYGAGDRDGEFLRDFKNKLDLVIEKWQDFLFIDEIYLERGFMGFILGEEKLSLKEYFKISKERTRKKEIKEISEKFLKELGGSLD